MDSAAVGRLQFSTMRARDLATIERQQSQLFALGQSVTYDEAEAEVLAQQSIAWTVRIFDDPAQSAGRILACFGVAETFEGRQGWGWALLSNGIGRKHAELSTFVQGQIAACTLPRLEVLTRGPDALEDLIAHHGATQADEILQLALSRPTPEMRWSMLLGLTPAHVLRCYGAASETYVLFERIRPAAAAQLQRAA